MGGGEKGQCVSIHPPLIILCCYPEDDGWLAGGVNVCVGQLGM